MHRHGFEGVRKLLAIFRQLSRVTTANEKSVDNALASQFHDFEDALQYYSALSSKVDVIITRNGKDFANSKIPVMSPREFFASLK